MVVRARCIGCGLCATHCPVGAVTMVGGKAVIDHGKCIACFCCQEFCESDAIAIGRPPLGRAITFAAKSTRLVRHLLRSG